MKNVFTVSLAPTVSTSKAPQQTTFTEKKTNRIGLIRFQGTDLLGQIRLQSYKSTEGSRNVLWVMY